MPTSLWDKRDDAAKKLGKNATLQDMIDHNLLTQNEALQILKMSMSYRPSKSKEDKTSSLGTGFIFGLMF